MYRDFRRLAVVAAPVLFAGAAAVGLAGNAAATTAGSFLGAGSSAMTPSAVRAQAVTPPVDIRSSSCPANIVEGDSGTCVVALQDLLSNWGYYADLGSSGADGSFGAHTLAAVKAFQAAAGIGVDGQVGPQTKAALYSNATPFIFETHGVNSYDKECLTADPNTAGQNGQKVEGWACASGAADEEWNVYWVPNSSTNRMFVNVADGECLDADTNTATVDGQKIQGVACNGSRAQQWYPKSGNAAANAYSGKCLDADTNTAGQNGQKIQGWTCNGSSEQSWLSS
jgi:hypothetical protein